jgi:hypothetical protein
MSRPVVPRLRQYVAGTSGALAKAGAANAPVLMMPCFFCHDTAIIRP